MRVAASWLAVGVAAAGFLNVARAATLQKPAPPAPRAPTAAAGTATTRARSAAPAMTLDEQRALLERYCAGCHNDRLKTAGLSLNPAPVDAVPAHAAIWEKVIKKLRAGTMPPDGRPRPDRATVSALVTSLEATLDQAYARQPDPGRTETFHRLNRTEYRNAVRDLLALDVDVSDLLPADDVSYGFDNIAGVLGVSPVLLERYTTAAQKISRVAIGSRSIPPTAETFRVASDAPQDEHIDGMPFGTRGGLLVRYTFPTDAEYAFRLRIARDYTDSLAPFYEPHQAEVAIDGARVQLFTVTPSTGGRGARNSAGPADGDWEIRVAVKAGPHVVTAAFLRKTAAIPEGQRIAPVRPAIGAGGDTRYEPYLGSLTISGPFNPTGAGETPSRRRILNCESSQGSQGARGSPDSHDGECARRILAGLARRAYRRPVTDADVKPLLAFYEQGRADGDFENGIELALRRLLVSPSFLFRIERDPANVAPNSVYRISNLELASRLSFFLWSTIPDDTLIDLAAQNRLTEPAVLAAQVRRMLASPKAQALVGNFAAEWLYLRNLPAFRPDEELFPDFDDSLRQAFRTETELFFESILRENRKVTDLLAANYTFLNERLARHYGVPNVYGSQFRRVTLPREMSATRAGLLGHGSILAVTSYPTRTSPVLRGKWVLDNLLGTPPPEPPPNVPALKENVEGAAALSVRERIEQHRSNPGCASCHKIMDPIGFSLERFDAVGRWRDVGEDGVPIDASGTLLDGTALDGPASLRTALLQSPDAFVKTVAEKLLIYGLGRGVEYYDQPAVRKIVRDAGGANATLPGLIMGIVRSAPFQMRRSES